MKILHWTKAGDFKGKNFEVFTVRWDVRSRTWIESPNPNARWGFRHPDTNEIVALKKRDLSYYGKVWDIEPALQPDIETKVEMGTPSLGIVTDEEE